MLTNRENSNDAETSICIADMKLRAILLGVAFGWGCVCGLILVIVAQAVGTALTDRTPRLGGKYRRNKPEVEKA